jgi:hypothetical protein
MMLLSISIFSKVDAILVPARAFNLSCEMNPQVCAKITPLVSSQPLLRAVVVGRSDFPQQRLKRLEPYLIMEHYPHRIRHLMSTFRITRIRHLEEGMLKEVKILLTRHLNR